MNGNGKPASVGTDLETLEMLVDAERIMARAAEVRKFGPNQNAAEERVPHKCPRCQEEVPERFRQTAMRRGDWFGEHYNQHHPEHILREN